jgi:hypothetical protein
MHHYHQVLVALLPCALLVLGQQEDIAAAVKACLQQSSVLNSCQDGEAGLQSLNTIPEETDVFIPRLELHLLQPPVDVKAIFLNNTLTGLSLFKLNSVGVNKTNATLSMSITIPQLVAVGNYELSGTAFVPLGFSASSYSAQFQDVQISGEAKLTVGKGQLLAIEGTPSLKVDLSNMTVAFDNLLEGRGKPHIAQLVHSFVNQEPKLFVQDFQPEIRKRVSGCWENFTLGLSAAWIRPSSGYDMYTITGFKGAVSRDGFGF